MFLTSCIESSKFEGEDDYENEIVPVQSSERVNQLGKTR